MATKRTVMTRKVRWSAVAAAVGLALTASLAAAPAEAQVRWDRGQNVAPVYEGWERNDDGSYTLYFGYLNRNYQETPQIPVGAANFFEPGPSDRGQPTHFYPRRQQFVFTAQVPAEWGDGERDLVWTLTHNGRTDKAFGTVWLAWELDGGVLRANRGMGVQGEPADNQRPAVSLPGGTELEVTLPDTVTLTAVLSDDGIPGPRPPRPEPADARAAAAARLRARRPSPTNQAVVSARAAGETGLAITWTHYRGDGTVTFDPAAIPIEGGRGGEAVTTVSFSAAGTYVLRGYADDSIQTTPVDVTVTVHRAATSP
jgi:hypothetical protein